MTRDDEYKFHLRRFLVPDPWKDLYLDFRRLLEFGGEVRPVLAEIYARAVHDGRVDVQMQVALAAVALVGVDVGELWLAESAMRVGGEQDASIWSPVVAAGDGRRRAVAACVAPNIGILRAASACIDFRGAPELTAECVRIWEALAVSTKCWIALADLAEERGAPAERVAGWLERALAAAATDDERSEVAAAFVRLLDDGVRADAIGPRGRPLAQQRAPGVAWTGYPAAAESLFEWLRPRVNSAVIAEVAGADYGQDRDRHRRALNDLWMNGDLPRRLDWAPLEVLRLTVVGDRGDSPRLAVLASAMVLCFCGREVGIEFTHVGIVALKQAELLGPDALAAAAPMFAWFADADGDECDRATAGLLLLLSQGRLEPGSARSVALARRLVEDRSWLWNLSCETDSSLDQLWQMARVDLEPLHMVDPAFGEILDAFRMVLRPAKA